MNLLHSDTPLASNAPLVALRVHPEIDDRLGLNLRGCEGSARDHLHLWKDQALETGSTSFTRKTRVVLFGDDRVRIGCGAGFASFDQGQTHASFRNEQTI